jgi:lipopolysaccharide/colanic/teichoic acid biosynthesis glycosyltransferase
MAGEFARNCVSRQPRQLSPNTLQAVRRPFRKLLQPALERIAAAAGLLFCAPLLLLLALCTVLESGRPVLFRQTRVGRRGKKYDLLKLRSMHQGMPGSRITAGGDPRVTRVGAFLRKYKLDELPQLWNVMRGDMQLIGPRPELPSLVNPADPLWRAVLSEKPGLTDLSTLVYRNEEELLSRSCDPDRTYREEVLPRKLRLSAYYSQTRNLLSDCKLLFLTVRYSFFPSGFDASRIERRFLRNNR